MRETRAQFKNTLRNCKQNEDQIRRENMLRNLNSNNSKEFWTETNKLKKSPNQQLNVIDEKEDSECIADLFSDKYKLIFDAQGGNKSDAKHVDINMNYSYSEIYKHLFSREDIHTAVKQLKPCIGFDKIHSNHLKFSSPLFEKLIANLFSSFLLHGFMSTDILRGTINPTVKDRFGNMQSSDNYRPVMSSSVFFKLFEYCLLDKIKNTVTLSDKQHGFRDGYSTSTACLVLKETVLNYTNADSNVYACFIDFSKAFDMVSHKILLEKLKKYGIPDIYINVIKYWYCNQFVNVRYGASFSDN